MKKKTLSLILEIVLLGVIVGVFIAFYQFLVHEITNISNEIFQGQNNLLIGSYLIVAILLSFLIIWLNTKYKGYLGSGIPQYEAYYDGNLDFSPGKMFGFVFFDSLYAYFAGFVFGGEGPSISLSASLARLFNQKFKREDDKELVACAGSAGFACAFLAPVAGFCHLIEENHHFVKPSFLIKGFFIIGIATLVSYFIYPHNLLPLVADTFLEYQYHYVVIVLTLLAFVVARLYVLAIIKVKDLSKHFKYFLYLTPFFVLLFLYIKTKDLNLGGSGGTILADPLFTTSITLLLFYLVYRLIGTAFSNSLAVSGGLVLPMLTLGAICGSIITLAFKDIIPNVYQYNSLFCIIGMLVVFNSVCNTPLTSLFLGLKMGKVSVVILPLLLALVLSTGLIYLFRQKNIYKLLEKRLVN